LQRFLAQVTQKGGKACVMEVSSHALDLGRVEGVDFDVAVFTNLTQDHLDFHKSMDAYGAAKSKLFSSLDPQSPKKFPKRCVINGGAWGGKNGGGGARFQFLPYNLPAPADLFVKNLVCDSTGSRFDLHAGSSHQSVKLPLLGEYNVMNALAAAGAGLAQEI